MVTWYVSSFTHPYEYVIIMRTFLGPTCRGEGTVKHRLALTPGWLISLNKHELRRLNLLINLYVAVKLGPVLLMQLHVYNSGRCDPSLQTGKARDCICSVTNKLYTKINKEDRNSYDVLKDLIINSCVSK